MEGYPGGIVFGVERQTGRRIFLNGRHASMASLLCALVLTAFSGHAQTGRSNANATPGITQRRINEVAATVEQVRRTMLDQAGGRKPGENLSGYVRRIAQPLPSESSVRYRQRIEDYLVLIEAAEHALKAEHLTQMPHLQDTSEANQTLWRRIVRTQGLLSIRLPRTRAAWTQTLRPLAGSSGGNIAPTGHITGHADASFGKELDETFQQIIVASDALRDAQP